MTLGSAREARHRERRGVVGLAVAAVAIAWLLGRVGALERAELAFFDGCMRPWAASDRTREGGVRASEVLLVTLGEADFDRFGYPIPDARLAEAIERLAEAGASAIGVDLYRPAPASAEAGDLAGFSALEAAVRRHGEVVMTELLPGEATPGIAAPAFAPADQVGFNNMLLDSDRAVRRGLLYSWDADGTAHVALALRLASLHLARAGVAVAPDPSDPDAIRLGATALPPLASDFGAYARLAPGGYAIALDFRRDPESFERVDLASLLAGRVDPARIAGRIVVVGTDAPSVKDEFGSPLGTGGVVTGQRLHAQLADQLVRAGRAGDRPPVSGSGAAEAGLTLLFGLAATRVALGSRREAGLAGRARRRIAGWPVVAVGFALPFALGAACLARGLWIPAVEPAVAWALAGGLGLAWRAREEARSRHALATLFARFSSAKVADALWRERDRILVDGRPRPQRVVLTALVSDLVGFTAAAEKLEPEALLAWVGTYMAAMTEVIERHGGHVDDYAGDGIKANFGVPVASESEEAIDDDARRAVACALAMDEALGACNRTWAAAGLPQARQRIGIETGPAVVGAIGSDARMKYTSLGDTINTAARLESFVEPEGAAGDEEATRILVGDATRRRLDATIDVEDRGLHRLKGKSDPIRIHRVRGRRLSEERA